MPVALLNELVLMGLGLYLGYKAGSKKEQLQTKAQSFKDKYFGKKEKDLL